MQWSEQDLNSALAVICQWVNSVFTPLINEMVCELLPEALLGSPAQSSCFLHQAAADRWQWSSLSELLHPASSGTAAAPSGRGNGMKVIQEGNRSQDVYVELQE